MSEVDEKTVSFDEMMESLKPDKDKESEKEKDPSEWLYVAGPGKAPTDGFTFLAGIVVDRSPKRDSNLFAKAKIMARMISLRGELSYAAELCIDEKRIESFSYEKGREIGHSSGFFHVISGSYPEG